MPLIVGENSNVSLEDANDYFELRINSSVWDLATTAKKGKALATATAILNNIDWLGEAESDSQLSAFPRKGSYYEPLIGHEIEFSGTPARVQKGTYELAFHLLGNETLLDDTGGVEDFKVGPISLKDIRSPAEIPSMVYEVIKPLRKRNSHNWWRAN